MFKRLHKIFGCSSNQEIIDTEKKHELIKSIPITSKINSKINDDAKSDTSDESDSFEDIDLDTNKVKVKPKYKKKSIPKAIRMQLWKNTFGDTLYGHCCACNREIQVDDFQAGHIIAEVNGGTTTLNNLRPICKPCNTSSGIMNLDEFTKIMASKANKVNKEIKTKK